MSTAFNIHKGVRNFRLLSGKKICCLIYFSNTDDTKSDSKLCLVGVYNQVTFGVGPCEHFNPVWKEPMVENSTFRSVCSDRLQEEAELDTDDTFCWSSLQSVTPGVIIKLKCHWVCRLASLGRPRCVAVFSPWKPWVIICTRSSWKQKKRHTPGSTWGS